MDSSQQNIIDNAGCKDLEQPEEAKQADFVPACAAWCPDGLPPHLMLIDKISVGGMAEIYRARHRTTGDKLAVKVMLPDLLRDGVNALRFTREAENVCKLKDPHIVAVHDYGMTKADVPLPFIVMDYVEGVTLASRVHTHGRLSYDDAVPVMEQIALALSHAHAQGIVHRDLTPANIMLERVPGDAVNIKLLDFGLSKALSETSTRNRDLTQTGEVVGTPCYMSPEQCLDRALDGRTDIYSLGCVMYDVLTGDPPFNAGSVVQVMAMQAHVLVPDIRKKRPDLPLPFAQIIMRCLEKDAADRYQSMEQVIRDLRSLQRGSFVGMRLTAEHRRQLRGLVQTVVFSALGFGIAMAVINGLQMVRGVGSHMHF